MINGHRAYLTFWKYPMFWTNNMFFILKYDTKITVNIANNVNVESCGNFLREFLKF